MKPIRPFISCVIFIIGLQASADQPLAPIQDDVTREWIGPEYWTNPLMNWRLADGRIENTHGGWTNEVHTLTHQLREGDGSFRMKVRLGVLDDSHLSADKPGFAGFKLGSVGHRDDYRSNILHHLQNGFCRDLMKAPPIRAGLSSDGRLIIGDHYSDDRVDVAQMQDLVLELKASYRGNTVTLDLIAKHGGQSAASMRTTIERDSLTGNVSLACHGVNPPANQNRVIGEVGHTRFWFSDWSVSGEKFQANPEQTFGPILWSQYTLHQNTLKLMAFFVPLENEAARQKAELQTRTGVNWKTIATSVIDPLSRTALFRVDDWDCKRDQEYRVNYQWESTEGTALASWGGTIRKDPVDQDTISLAALSCSNSDLFPNRFLTNNLLAQDPDLVFFSGDQIYEANGGYGVVRADTAEDVPRATLNYLEKFWLSVLGFRDLLKDRPSVMVPDDHDLYSNDLWGKGGIAMGEHRCFGGYGMHADWVNMVEYTQMGHRPDPYDATPIAQGIKVYTTSLSVGDVSFALINDRKFKSAPGDVVDAMEPLFIERGERNYPLMDTINEKHFDTSTLDRADLDILGDRQLAFLQDWAKNDAKLRAVLHQSPFCQPHHLMVADLDSNGWPQTGRRRALEAIREANAVMVAGDLHFATLVQHGIDDWEDAGWQFTLPSVSTNTHRAWRPDVLGQNRQPGMPDYTGRFRDGWGNKMTLWAAANPRESMVEDPYRGDGEETLAYLRETAQGYGMIRFHKSDGAVTFESWPVYGDFDGPDGRTQHPGFPKTVKVK
ncbi:MAG: hypothetical protein SynsKO_06700 [Synoicihabitans sp.]